MDGYLGASARPALFSCLLPGINSPLQLLVVLLAYLTQPAEPDLLLERATAMLRLSLRHAQTAPPCVIQSRMSPLKDFLTL